jgi:RHS repeat-associated protein
MNRCVIRAGLVLSLLTILLVPPSASGREPDEPAGEIIGQSRTLLPDGRWLLLGGHGPSGSSTSSAAILEVGARTVTLLASNLRHPRAGHSATVLPDGTVLVVGGIGLTGGVVPEAEIFDPRAAVFEPRSAGPTPRAHHTATLLTDGRVLLVGGVGEDGALHAAAELWDPRSGGATVTTALVAPRLGHGATLLADGSVLISGGTNPAGASAPGDEAYEPATQRFRAASAPPAASAGGASVVETIAPADGSTGLPLSPLIGIRLSAPVRVETANSETVSLNGPHGPETVLVTPAEGGMLAFAIAQSPLRPGAVYTVTVNGLVDHRGYVVPFASSRFTTAPEAGAGREAGGSSPGGNPSRESATVQVSADPWEWPGERRAGRPYSQWQALPPLEAPAGLTAVAGQVLRLDGEPLADVTLRIRRGSGAAEARTDGTGRFLLEGVPAGRQELLIDGRSASRPGRTYGVFEVGIEAAVGRTTPLGYTVWMPRIDTAHAIPIPTYTTRELVVTTPRIPGLEVHIPVHAAVRDHEGKLATEISITPIPPDRPPFPLPRDVDTPAYFTIQPGAGYVYGRDGQGARVIYPNHSGAKREVAGARFSFWHYDPAEKGWHIYGMGTVTADGERVVPDPKVELYELTGAMAGPPRLLAGPSLGLGNGLPAVQISDGEPVVLAAGFFQMRRTDLAVEDLVPIVLTRTYLSGDSRSRAFGRGSTHPYDIFLVGDVNPYTYVDLYLADGTWIHYHRISSGTGFGDAVYEHSAAAEHTATPTAFFGSRITWNPEHGGWDLRLKDGTVYQFPEASGATRSQWAALKGYRDRYGNALTLTRDGERNLTRITTPGGRWIELAYDGGFRITQARDNIGRTVTYGYDGSGRLSTVTDPAGGTTTYTYDATGWMATITDPRGLTYLTNEYDSTGKVIRQTQPLGIVWQFAYTLGPGGVVTQVDVTDPRGTIRRVAFNLAGYPVSDTRGLGSPEQQTTTYQWQAGTNRLGSITDQLGRQTIYGYDTMGNLASVTRLAGTAEAVTTTLTYEPTFNQLTSIRDPLLRTTSFFYDVAGNPTTITDPLGQATTITYAPTGQPLTVTTPAGTTRLVYDVGDLVSVTDPLGRATARFVDGAGRVVSVTDPRGNRTRYQWDALNRLTRVTDALGGVTHLGYDPNGNLLTLTDARSSVTTYTYDSMDRVTTRRDPLNRSDAYTYDLNGNLLQVTDRRGKVTRFGHDSLNRRTFTGFGQTGSSTYESTVTDAYDAGNRLRTVADSLAGALALTYDNLDRLTLESSPQGTVGYGYDPAGRRTTMSVAGMADSIYSYDDGDRLTRITRGSASVGFTYDAADRRTRLTLPNGVTVDYSYDAASQLTGLTYKKGASTLGALTYAYDAGGNRAQAGGTWARTGLPDAVSAATYNAANQQLTLGGRTMTYDLAGNLQTLTEPTGTTNFTWDARGRLTTLTGAGTTASFLHDGLGRRTAKIIDGVRTDYLHDGLTPVRELRGTATANLLTGREIDEYFTRTTSAGTRTLLTDALGSTIALTDDTGAVQSEYTYEPFGGTTETGADANPFQYTGRENDGTGLYYYRARYYHPGLQRFVSEDPIEFAGGDGNLYAYVFNAPVQTTDPTGEIAPAIAAGVACAAGAVGGVVVVLSGRKPSLGQLAAGIGIGCAGGLVVLGAGTAAAPVAAVGATAAAPAQVVIGRFPAYLEKGRQLGARTFEIPQRIYSAMTPAERWAANQKFLDRAIARGDDFVLASPLTSAEKGSTFAREVQYLLSKGYQVSLDGSRLVRQ